MKDRRKRKVHRGRRKPNRFVTWFKGLSKKKKIAIYVGGAVLLLLLIVGIFVISKFNKIQTADFDENDIIVNEELDASLGEGYTTFALFAGDSRTGQLNKGVRSDGIIIVSLNNETGEVKMTSVYRDTLLDLTDGRLQKCNSAYSYGGAQQAVSMLNMNLDLNIQKFVTVDFTAVSDVIDLLGGIQVQVSDAEARAVNKFIGETARVAKKKANRLNGGGLLTLDGVQATTYGRIRKGVGDDYARTERQRLIIQKAIEKALKSNLSTLNKIVDKVLPKIYTNFTKKEILSYGAGLAKYKIGETKGFPFDKSSGTISGKGSCVVPITLASNVTKLHEFLFGTTDYKPSSKVNTISGNIQYLVGNRTPDPDTKYDPNKYTVDDVEKETPKKDDEPEEDVNEQTTKHKHKWSTAWAGSDTHHWHECTAKGCNVTDNTLKNGYGAHSGGQATCSSGAICTTCGIAYGQKDANIHGEIEIRDAKEPTATEKGHTGNKYCKGCGVMVEAGQELPVVTTQPEGDGGGQGDQGGGESQNPGDNAGGSTGGDNSNTGGNNGGAGDGGTKTES